MNFGKSFSYIFEDPEWFNKLWKPVLCILIPFIGPVLFQGYTMSVTRNVVNGDPKPLHEMDFSENLLMGFRLLIVQLVYALPFIMLGWLFYVITIKTVATAPDPSAFLKLYLPVFFGQFGVYLLSLLVSIVYYFIFPVISAHVAVKGTIMSGFEFKEMFKLVKNKFQVWLMVLAGSLIAGFISPAGLVAFVVGVIITMAYAQLMLAHLSGQAYREASGKAYNSVPPNAPFQ